MNKTTFSATLLHEHYTVDVGNLQEFTESDVEGYLVYRIQDTTGKLWIARAYRRNRHALDWFQYFYPWSMHDTAEWLLTRAATLSSLEEQDYPAPRVLRTRSGQLIARTDTWCILITTFIEGTVLQPTLEQLRLMGVALGHLHTLRTDRLALAQPPIGKSNWYPEDALANGLAYLAAIEHLLPVEWVSLHADFRHTFKQITARTDLPMTIIHADGWAANAVQTKADRVVFIDWDCSGSGLAILDLGKLLLECHLDSNLPPAVPLAWHIQPDASRILAVVEGYTQRRRPTSAELDVLLDAIRFNIAFIGALHLSQELQEIPHDQAWIRGMERRWARIQNRWAVSSEVARIAYNHFQ